MKVRTHTMLKASASASSAERFERLNRIVEAFNAIRFNESGAVEGEGISEATRRDLRDMLLAECGAYTKIGNRISLALEVSQIVQNLGSEPARRYFHRILQLF